MENLLARTTKIDGTEKTYELNFTIDALIRCEEKLKNGSILGTLADPPYSMNDTMVFLEAAIDSKNKKTTYAAYMDIMTKNNFGDLQTKIVEALQLSGVLGKTTKN